MSDINLNEKDILEYVRDMISSAKGNMQRVEDARYHHNTAYKDAVSVCKHGIMTLKDQNTQGIRKDSNEFLRIMDDKSSHVNGIDSVSLAVVNLKDIYPDELVYDPFLPSLVDFLISSDIKAYRNAINYGNEFLCYNSISNQELRSIDTRLLKLATLIGNKYQNLSSIDVAQRFNYLIEIATEVRNQELNIFLREMSNGIPYLLNIDKISESPKIIIKK